ncbi:MAG: FixH family protein, partial [Alphaproteobacteria bacterium]
VKALFVRPVQRGHDIALSLEAASPGRYAATVRPTLPGQWEARVEAKTAEGEWRGRARVNLPRAAAP